MRAVRRLLQVVAIVGTLLVGILAVALIVSQTPWFRDWLRRYVVRESEQYVNGQLSIGGIGGNLFFGVQLRDVALDVSGERIVAAGCHPTSRLEVADLLALVGSATAGTPPQWKPLLDRRNILSRARLLHLGSHLMVLRLEMCFRSVRLRPAG